jgi:DNA polymerase I
MRYATKYGTVTLVETVAEMQQFETFLADNGTLAVDTETTGLDIFTAGFAVRLVQFGTATEAFVLALDRHRAAITEALQRGHRLIMHNAAYDIMVLSIAGVATVDQLYPRTHDTRTVAHLLDPRGKQDGAIGHSLKALSDKYVDSQASSSQTDLKDIFKENGWTWQTVPVNHELYVTYAGMDVLLTSRLYSVLHAMLDDAGTRLLEFEMRVQAATTRMQMRGMHIDVPYAESLLPHFDGLAADGQRRASEWGVENVNSVKQVAEVLTALGAKLTEKTDNGNIKVDKMVLAKLIAGDNVPAAELAQAVSDTKAAKRNRGTYVEKVLAERDAVDRVHPWIHSLQARTARMSVTNPPLHQLPSGDWHIRRMFIPDDGMTMIAADYSQVELRVLAVLADERKMIDAVNAGLDLHDVTATNLFGADFTKAQRKLAKNVGFGRVYGGGAGTLSRQAGVPLADAKRAMAGYDSAFPGIKRFSKRLQERAAHGKPQVITPAGRVLPMDRERSYTATNYVVQSTARDVLANAILELEAAGLGEHLLLPIHDEVLCQVPTADAAEIAAEVARVMTVPFGNLTLTAEAEVYGPSWGHGYGATA